ncbi:hypothetical protein [Nitrosospira sp. Nsp18]|uniref:hypothetical protein n=1 Tax=Nitrosospira sp. Nsp18 TaxID=1855334 RepID=UPI00115F8C41|nr:hypothetical protein [Nitrosospira sp. Nsp18]
MLTIASPCAGAVQVGMAGPGLLRRNPHLDSGVASGRKSHYLKMEIKTQAQYFTAGHSSRLRGKFTHRL